MDSKHPEKAHEVEGFILKIHDWSGNGKHKTMFRVYSKDKKSFTDYHLWTCDLEVKIQDKHNHLIFTEKDGKNVLDYNDEVLGIKK